MTVGDTGQILHLLVKKCLRKRTEAYTLGVGRVVAGMLGEPVNILLG